MEITMYEKFVFKLMRIRDIVYFMNGFIDR